MAENLESKVGVSSKGKALAGLTMIAVGGLFNKGYWDDILKLGGGAMVGHVLGQYVTPSKQLSRLGIIAGSAMVATGLLFNVWYLDDVLKVAGSMVAGYSVTGLESKE